ncbi:MAG: hypothetical protein IPJ20_06435 [Flammeovirgaceae bacterium]|nr:hypothetical protein [Flammeovirgaceae bacterium]
MASKIYGDSDPILNGTLSGFLSADEVTATYSRTEGESVLNSPYTISAALSPIEVLSNYDVIYNTALFSINKKPASVTPVAATKVYGELDPAFSGALSGFLVADGITATYSRTSGESVTVVPYSINATLQPVNLLGNYDITYTLADFTITKAQLNASADNLSRMYGENNPTFTISYTGFKNGDNEGVLNPKPIASTVANQSSSVGPYEISLAGGGATNYSISTSNGILEITKAKLTVTADDKVIECCFTFPSLSSTITGFVNGDTEASLVTGGPSYYISGNFNWAGVYSIVPKNLRLSNSSNYEIEYKEGTLYVIPNRLTAKAIEPTLFVWKNYRTTLRALDTKLILNTRMKTMHPYIFKLGQTID